MCNTSAPLRPTTTGWKSLPACVSFGEKTSPVLPARYTSSRPCPAAQSSSRRTTACSVDKRAWAKRSQKTALPMGWRPGLRETRSRELELRLKRFDLPVDSVCRVVEHLAGHFAANAGVGAALYLDERRHALLVQE